MTIEIIETRFLAASDEDDIPSWACFIEISQGQQVYILPVGAPGDLDRSDLQAYFEGKEVEILRVADIKEVSEDSVYSRDVLQAFALMILDEINLLRQVASLQPRTINQLRTALKNKLKGL